MDPRLRETHATEPEGDCRAGGAGVDLFLEACGLSESDPEVPILATLIDSTASRTSEETFCSQCFRS